MQYRPTARLWADPLFNKVPSRGFELDDIAALIVLFIASSLYATRGILWAKPEPGFHRFFESPQKRNNALSSGRSATTRNIVTKMKELVSTRPPSRNVDDENDENCAYRLFFFFSLPWLEPRGGDLLRVTKREK